MHSAAQTVEQYIAELPDDRRPTFETVRRVIVANLPEGYEEVMNWGMVTYQVPLQDYPDSYNKQPLMYAALASQKNGFSLYAHGLYMNDQLRQAFEAECKATGKKLNMGKSCIRFNKVEDLPLDVIGKYIARVPMKTLIQQAKSVARK